MIALFVQQMEWIKRSGWYIEIPVIDYQVKKHGKLIIAQDLPSYDPHFLRKGASLEICYPQD